MSQLQLAQQMQRGERWVRKVELGQATPNLDDITDLARVLRVDSSVILGLAPMPTRVPVVAGSPPVASPSSEIQPAEIAALAEASTIGTDTVADVEEATYRLRRAYSRTPSPILAADLRSQLAANWRLLNGQVRPSQRGDLLAATGWASLLLGTVMFDMEQREPAWHWRRAALAIARELGHGELEAWCWETAAWFSLAGDRWHDTIRYSEAGIALAPTTSVLVALHLQIARAAARLGDSSATGSALRAAEATLERLTDSEDNGDHYRFDAGKLPGFAAAAYVAIGDARAAAEQARTSIAISGDPRSASYRPMRVNSAHADLGMAAALLGDVEEAAREGILALSGTMLHPEAIKRVEELAMKVAPHGDVGMVRDLRERLRTTKERADR